MFVTFGKAYFVPRFLFRTGLTTDNAIEFLISNFSCDFEIVGEPENLQISIKFVSREVKTIINIFSVDR